MGGGLQLPASAQRFGLIVIRLVFPAQTDCAFQRAIDHPHQLDHSPSLPGEDIRGKTLADQRPEPRAAITAFSNKVMHAVRLYLLLWHTGW